MSNSRVKSLLKGLRYISQRFENEKEAEMKIGYPTDVKHVAHIGWDGPSVNSPSWMNEFKASPSFSSAPLSLHASGDNKEDVSVKWLSEDRRSRRVEKGSSSSAKNLTAPVTKTSKYPSSLSSTECPTCTERSSERQKTRRSSKPKESSSDTNTNNNHSPTLSLPDVPRQTRRKKTTRTKRHLATETYKSPYSDPGSFTTATGTGPISLSKDDSDLCQTP